MPDGASDSATVCGRSLRFYLDGGICRLMSQRHGEVRYVSWEVFAVGLVIAPAWSVSLYRRAPDAMVRSMLDGAAALDLADLERALHSKPTMADVEALRRRYPNVFQNQASLYVAHPSLRLRGGAVKSVVCTAAVPRWSFGMLPDGAFCPLPAHAVVALGAELPMHFLVELACELAGSYRKDSRDLRGMIDRAPVLTVERLKEFADAAEGMRGVKRARQACWYVAEGSASPMETTLYTLLCLGVRQGGAGLPKPELNARIDLPVEQRRLAKRDFLRADMLWRQQKLVVEYDSDLAHADSHALNCDASRRNALQAVGYTVVTVTKDQVFNWGQFCSLTAMLAGMLGKAYRAKKDWSDLRFRVWRDLVNPVRFGSGL